MGLDGRESLRRVSVRQVLLPCGSLGCRQDASLHKGAVAGNARLSFEPGRACPAGQVPGHRQGLNSKVAAPELWRQPCLLDGVSSACALCTLGSFAATEVQAQDKGQITGTQTGGVTRTIITQMDVPNSNYVTVIATAAIPAEAKVTPHPSRCRIRLCHRRRRHADGGGVRREIAFKPGAPLPSSPRYTAHGAGRQQGHQALALRS